MVRILLYIGLIFFVPGLAALGYSLYEGPGAWLLDRQTFWGTPISLFVFWIGLAHAGTLLSAIFLALGIKMDKRTAMLAELSTLCSLVVAGLFPLVHLGILKNFYMVIPLADARMNFANVGSPLVWDFCCIAVYGALSLLFFVTHLKTCENPSFGKWRRPLAWLLLPLVLWVHTIVSLDFATTFVPEWRGAFFPVYFIVGAIFSGLALVNLLLCTEGYRMRVLELLMMVFSWGMIVIWLWDFVLKGTFSTSAFIFAGVLPQLRWVGVIRDSRIGRIAMYLSILFGMLLERLFLVAPGLGDTKSSTCFGMVDLGLVSFSVGLFMLLFFGLRRALDKHLDDVGAFFGEVDGSDMVQEGPDVSKDYVAPWDSKELKMLRFPLFAGLSSAVLFCVWSLFQQSLEYASLSVVNVIPLFYPVMAFVAAFVILDRMIVVEKAFKIGKRGFRILVGFFVLVAFGLGAFYGGGSSELASVENATRESSADSVVSVERAALIWNSRCASCHGMDGKFNEKFVREFYPVPQKLDSIRIDSLGVDSLTRVILSGRNNMNAYEGRLTEAQARGLVLYMKSLARQAGEAK